MIKFVFRWAFRLLLLLIVLVVAFALLKDDLVKSFAERRIRQETGMEVKIGKFEARLLTPTLTIENFKLYNTEEFGGSLFVDLPEWHHDYDPARLASGQLHLKLLRLKVTEINVVENKEGRNNLETVQKRLEQRTGSKRETEHRRRMDFTGVDTLNLTIGKLNYLSLKRPKQNRAFDLNLKNEIVKNVKSEADLSSLIVKSFLRVWYLHGSSTPPLIKAPSSTDADTKRRQEKAPAPTR